MSISLCNRSARKPDTRPDSGSAVHESPKFCNCAIRLSMKGTVRSNHTNARAALRGKWASPQRRPKDR